MKTTMKKIAAATILAVAATGAHAEAIISMTLADTINAATNSLGSDGKSGAFRFAPINPTTYLGASSFTGNVNSGIIDVTQANATHSFTTGFTFAGSNMGPNTTGPILADITGGVMTISSLPWGGYYAGASWQFNMPADSYSVLNLIQTGVNGLGQKSYAYRVGFAHTITSQDDPSFQYVGQNANWIIEGTVTAVPEAETYAMMLAGLGLVGTMVRRRRNTMA